MFNTGMHIETERGNKFRAPTQPSRVHEGYKWMN